jgi:hypothetical protein
MKRITQTSQVVDAMRTEGGYATLKRLYETVNFSSWATKTPEASVRRIVQNSPGIFFKIQPGLWALEECREQVLRTLKLKAAEQKGEDVFNHAFYQGLLIEIGKFRRLQTYIPPQDQNRRFFERRLGDMADTTVLPQFTYEKILRRARTIDVIWFNSRGMPADFYEVEHTTDIRNSLTKFYELQDFHARFSIVADSFRRREYEDKLQASVFESIAKRVRFLDYERVATMHEGLVKVAKSDW